MSASRDSSEFVEPAPRPSTSNSSTTASTSRVALSNTTETTSKPHIELLSDDDAVIDNAVSNAATRSGANDLDAEPNTEAGPSTSKQTSPSSSSPSKHKIFLKSTSPSIPLHIHLPGDLDHQLYKKLQITIRQHGGVVESRIAKADLVVVDPQLKAVSRKLFKIATEIGQPIPVVTFDYIQDCASQAQRLDVDDPKYKFSPTQTAADLANLPAPAPRALNGRNPYTEEDRQAIIAYFVDRDESSWSLNAAAKELADRIPTHTSGSFQSYLQANFERGWNLKEKILVARREALEGEPSELRARILRSQYTPTPGPTEQSAPSDGWPRTSPRPQATAAQSTSPRNSDGQERVDEQSSQSDDDQDLQVRQPNPGATINNVEKSPTKLKQPVRYASSDASSAGTSPPPSISLAQPPPGVKPFTATSSADEESDPDEYSPRILKDLQRIDQSQPQPSQKARAKPRRAVQSSDSSDDSELDQLDQDSDEDLLTTGPPPSNASPRAKRKNADQSKDSEWEGSRRLDSKMRGPNSNDTRTKFTQAEKDDLLNKLVDHVVAKGTDLPVATQDAIVAKPEDSFWERFAAIHPTHSVFSWRSHYLKNRTVYKHMIDLMIQDRIAEQAVDGSGEEESDSEQSVGKNGDGNDDHSIESGRNQELQGTDQVPSSRGSQVAAKGRSQQPQAKPSSRNSSGVGEESIPDDGIVVMITPLANERPPRTQRLPDQQWPEAPPPPPIQDEDEDMLQVEAEIDAIVQPSELAAHDSANSAQEEAPAPQIGEEDDLADAVPALLEDPAKEESSYRPTESSEEPPVRASSRIATQAARLQSASRISRASMVEAGTPVLAQHRDAPFYDFTIDSDEERRIRKARSRPSLPNLQSRQERTSPRQPKPIIKADHVLGHFATPSRNQRAEPIAAHRVSLPSRQGAEDRIQRTREWTRSVSANESSASPDPLPIEEPVAIAESSRSRASRIDRRHLLGAPFASDLTPSRPSRRTSGGRYAAVDALVSPAHARIQANQANVSRDRRPSQSALEAARMRYRAEVDQFRAEFDLDKEQLRNLLARFKHVVKDARNYILAWLDDMYEKYGVEADVAFEYIKTSQGDFVQAETFLKLAATTRDRSTPNRSLSRSFSRSKSPLKRSLVRDERSFTGAESSKRYRR